MLLTPRRLPSIALRAFVLALVLCAGAAVAAAPPAHAKGCGQVSARYATGEGGAAVRITRVKHVSCTEARRLAKRCIARRRAPNGWKTGADASRRPLREVLWRGAKTRIEWVGIAGGAALCTSAAVAEALSESA